MPKQSSSSQPKQQQQQNDKQDKKKGMFGRRTWDEQVYAQKASDREERMNSENDHKRKLPVASSMLASERKPLQARSSTTTTTTTATTTTTSSSSSSSSMGDLTRNVGKRTELQFLSSEEAGTSAIRRVNTNDSGSTGSGGAFYCDLCQCSIKDSISYVDHLNSRLHISNMGMGMRAQRATLDAVLKKLDQPPLPHRNRNRRGGGGATATTSSSSGSSRRDQEEAELERKVLERQFSQAHKKMKLHKARNQLLMDQSE